VPPLPQAIVFAKTEITKNPTPPPPVKPPFKELEFQLEEAFKSPVKFFQTDIDPFSSSSSASSKQPSRQPSFANKQNSKMTEPKSFDFDDAETEQLDFDKIDELLNTSKPFSDPFAGLNLVTAVEPDRSLVQQQPEKRSQSTSSSSISSPNVSPILKRVENTLASTATTQDFQQQELVGDKCSLPGEIANDAVKTNDDETESSDEVVVVKVKTESESETPPRLNELKIPTIEIIDNVAINTSVMFDEPFVQPKISVSEGEKSSSIDECFSSSTSQVQANPFESDEPQWSEINSERSESNDNYFKRSTVRYLLIFNNCN
jgi:hypothetical protein